MPKDPKDTESPISRRALLRTCGAATAMLLLPESGCASKTPPSFLRGYETLYRDDPRRAATEWFRAARFGLMTCYGLYSLLERDGLVMVREKIPVAEYVKLKDRFTAEKFDADKITDLALAADMKYVNFLSRFCDSFCLFRTKETDFTSLNSPAKRDLVGEMADACRQKGLGLFLYYSYALDWVHPYFPTDKDMGQPWLLARPSYDPPEPSYRFRKDEDFKHYIRFVHNQLRELLTQYGPIAGIWFDPIRGYYARPDLFPINETYALIRSLQPGCLISFKQGGNGDEDFVAPERKAAAHKGGGEFGRKIWEMNRGKPVEICETSQPYKWGYCKRDDGKHKTADDVMRLLADAKAQNANLQLDSSLLPDGSIHPEDETTLREVGRRLRMQAGSRKA